MKSKAQRQKTRMVTASRVIEAIEEVEQRLLFGDSGETEIRGVFGYNWFGALAQTSTQPKQKATKPNKALRKRRGRLTHKRRKARR